MNGHGAGVGESCDSIIDGASPRESVVSQTRPNGRKDIWMLMKEAKEREKKSENSDAGLESTLFVCGTKRAGKTSVILRFLDREEPPLPTVALEYTFGRRTRGVNSVKDITHIWELAGGTFLSDLVEIPVTESNVHTITFVVVLDLSEPANLLATLTTLFTKIRSRVDSILGGLEERGSKRPKALRSHAWKKFGVDHPDKDAVNPSPVPIVIIGNKYDLFRDTESEMRKLMCKTLRYMAHMNGASLCRQILHHHAFRSTPLRGLNVDHNKPIAVVAGADSFSQIGLPPSEMSKDVVGRTTVAALDTWRKDYERYFGPPVEENNNNSKDAVDLSKYPEEAVDSMRQQKDEELEKLRLANDRKAKERDLFAFLSGNPMANTGDKKKLGSNKSYSRAKAAQMTA
ncbi:uncharacterized protein BJ171DRAFT_582113 [Polychytrium aggregatum]|uniref:uncharacterized protein n=1 Tax=Polychytrium aggregatum TaxID=110093 RepID=UPI0022FE947A|nr:uncharacterized protein BJ171DRAFT_582113 [Polychytrium aggregatum]KAI9204137.1 hypothetical protein BJ171DRAFT_582113 [Polychytrium aggregatum]